MKLYIAARSERAAEADHVADKLIERGHEVISTWHMEPASAFDAYVNGTMPAGMQQHLAERDLAQLLACDGLIFLAEEPGSKWARNARFVEFGIALVSGHVLFLVGPHENIFSYHPNITKVSGTEELYSLLA